MFCVSGKTSGINRYECLKIWLKSYFWMVINSLRRIGLVSMALLGLVFSFCLNESNIPAPALSGGFTPSTENFHSIESVKWHSGFIQSAHIISSTGHFSAPPHKNSFNQFFAINRNQVALINLSFLFNPYFLQKCIVRFSHTDLIYPFHFFL